MSTPPPRRPTAAELVARGEQLLAARSPLQAVQSFRAALAVEPGSIAARFGIGVASMDLGDATAAQSAFGALLALAPGHAEAHFNLGLLARRRGDYRSAAEHFRASAATRPQHTPSLVNLGLACMRLSRYEEAVVALRAALAIDPAQTAVRGRLGVALAHAGRFFDSLAPMESAIAADGGDEYLVQAYAHVLHLLAEPERAEAALRLLVDRGRASPAAHSNLLMLMHFSPGHTPERMFEEHLRWAKLHAGSIAPPAPHANHRDAQRRLRVGLMTPHVTAGPVPSVLAPLLAHADRGRLEFFVYANSGASDAVTSRLRAMVGEWRRVDEQGDDELAAAIRADAIDVLFDLAGHSGGNRLLAMARKPAPVQVTWLDYFDTTGLAAIDYVLSDPVHTPPRGPQRFVERVLEMPVTRLCFEPPAAAPPVAPSPALARGHLTFGSFNRYAKTTEPVIELWAAVLKDIPDSILVLKSMELGSDAMRMHARERFARHGIPASRLDLRGPSPYAELLAEYSDVDVALDTFPHNGGATTMDALWMGVPVLALAGDSMISRQSMAMLHACGLDEFVAPSGPDLVGIAVRLDRERGRLSMLRAGIRERVAASPLCDGARFARGFESAVRRAWREWCAGA